MDLKYERLGCVFGMKSLKSTEGNLRKELQFEYSTTPLEDCQE